MVTCLATTFLGETPPARGTDHRLLRTPVPATADPGIGDQGPESVLGSSQAGKDSRLVRSDYFNDTMNETLSTLICSAWSLSNPLMLIRPASPRVPWRVPFS